MLIPADRQKALLLKKDQKFKLKLEDKPKINLKHLVYYTLLWIACVKDHCNLYYVLKTKISKYPKRMEWNNSKRKFQDTKVMHKWYLLAVQYPKYLPVKPGRFITEEYLSGQ